MGLGGGMLHFFAQADVTSARESEVYGMSNIEKFTKFSGSRDLVRHSPVLSEGSVRHVAPGS